MRLGKAERYRSAGLCRCALRYQYDLEEMGGCGYVLLIVGAGLGWRGTGLKEEEEEEEERRSRVVLVMCIGIIELCQCWVGVWRLVGLKPIEVANNNPGKSPPRLLLHNQAFRRGD